MIDPISPLLITAFVIWQICKIARATSALISYSPIRAKCRRRACPREGRGHPRAQVDPSLVGAAQIYAARAKCTPFLDEQHARYAVSRTCRRPMRIALILN